ncbi:hypothetical protein HCN44_010114 [Aphidius gifuensis]|uniref:Uncharacterized protein n=2 Tax=Aphidius gifuensis TaxID=684658 RepID=A0A834XYJ2_APHGI|nr:hypothetical protein HCN44_010114 [Aphidius gifuensis]
MPKQFGDLTMKHSDSSFYSTLFPKYFIIQFDRPIVSPIFTNEGPGLSHVSTTSSSFSYGGRPIYDYKIHLKPIYSFPNLNPVYHPSYEPQYPPQFPQYPQYPSVQIPQIPQRPLPPLPPSSTPPPTPAPMLPPFNNEDNDDNDDRIEKLDEKVDPSNPNVENFDDTVTIESSD